MPTPAEPAVAERQEARSVVATLRRHGWRLLLVFACIVLPLWGFGELADEVREQETIAFDEPLLLFAQALARDGFDPVPLDSVFLWLSRLGYEAFVVPFDIALVLALALWRRYREATFAALALGGSALLNLAAKQSFARARPSLWESIAPEATYSFPSGHAMGSMTLACVLVALAWRTRARWPVVLVMGLFTLGIGLSRVYLGVHYPSDILAGWGAAMAWVMAVYLVVYRGEARPWRMTGKPVSPR